MATRRPVQATPKIQSRRPTAREVADSARTALDIYVEGGYTLPALENSLTALVCLKGPASDKQFDELRKRICLAANGSAFAMRVSADEVQKALRFLIEQCDKPTPTSSLEALRLDWTDFGMHRADLIARLATDAERVCRKLVTHLGKMRNPDARVDCFVSSRLAPLPFVGGGSATSRGVTVADAQLVGWRWFWEASLIIDGRHRSVVDLLRPSSQIESFLPGVQLATPQDHLAESVDGLAPQLLFPGKGGFVAITPLTSVACLSRITSPDPTASIRGQRSVREYGGSNPRNIGGILMDRNGVVAHPVCIPVRAIETRDRALVRKLYRLPSLIRRVSLTEPAVERLFAPRLPVHTNTRHFRRIANLITPLLEDISTDLMAAYMGLKSDALSLSDAERALLDGPGPIAAFLRGAKESEVYAALAALIWQRNLPEQRGRDFQRWGEIVSITRSWLEEQH